MAKLETRVRKLEESAERVDLESMTDDELMQYAKLHWKAPPWGSRETTAAILTMVQRKPSTIRPVPTEELPLEDEDRCQPAYPRSKVRRD